jgi:hypothetical protein
VELLLDDAARVFVVVTFRDIGAGGVFCKPTVRLTLSFDILEASWTTKGYLDHSEDIDCKDSAGHPVFRRRMISAWAA